MQETNRLSFMPASASNCPTMRAQAAKGAGPEAVFPVSFIGRDKPL
jgi:hypothetical protein